MKKFFLIATIQIALVAYSYAQFDDKFYFPSKEWKSVEDVQYKEMGFDVDSSRLHCLFLESEGNAKATVFFFHGSGGNVTTYIPLVKPLVANGYQVFMFSPRGYGKSSGKPTHLNIANDAQKVFDSVIGMQNIKDTKIIVYGASMGTQVAAKITKDNQQEIHALVLDGAITSFTDIALASVPKEQKEFIAKYVTSPYSAIENVKSLKDVPKLIVHSKQDESVPFHYGKSVYDSASHPKSFWEYQGKHLEAMMLYPERYIQKIDSLLIKSRSGNKHHLKVTISGLKNSEGQVALQLKTRNGKLIRKVVEDITGNESTMEIDGLSCGEYTIQYFHDENSNQKLDKSIIGIPKEGYGFSNNANGKFGPPPIEKQLMRISKSTSIKLKPVYL